MSLTSGWRYKLGICSFLCRRVLSLVKNETKENNKGNKSGGLG